MAELNPTKIAIIGVGGLVGREFTRQLVDNHQVLPLRHADLNITDPDAVQRLLLDERPALIINCAVVGVDACEEDPSLARAVNVTGAETLAKAAADIDAEFVHLSTNYVFSGKRNGDPFYTLEDLPTPINLYGQTKLAGEYAVTKTGGLNYIIRTSWVFGDGKANFFSTTPHSLNAARKVRAITDVWANATYVRDLVRRVLEIIHRKHYSTYHVVNHGLCSYYEFALEAARILEISPDKLPGLIEPIECSEFQHRAERPTYTPLRCLVSEQLNLDAMRNWRSALAEYIHGEASPD